MWMTRRKKSYSLENKCKKENTGLWTEDFSRTVEKKEFSSAKSTMFFGERQLWPHPLESPEASSHNHISFRRKCSNFVAT